MRIGSDLKEIDFKNLEGFLKLYVGKRVRVVLLSDGNSEEHKGRLEKTIKGKYLVKALSGNFNLSDVRSGKGYKKVRICFLK